MRKTTALFLVFSLLALSGNLFAKKKGAELIIQKTNFLQVNGELIAVKGDSLLLKDSESGIDVSVDINDIRVIKIVRKSEALHGGIIGLLLGAGVGYAVGYPQGSPSGFIFSKAETGGIGAAIGGLIGGLIGVGIGPAVLKDKKIQIEGKSDSEIQKIKKDLRSKARVRYFQ